MTRLELSEIIPLITRWNDHAIISARQALIFKSIPEWQELIHIENESSTVNWKAETLPDCEAGTYRLWPIKEWQLTDNIRIKARAEAEKRRLESVKRHEMMLEKRNRIIKHFTTLVPPVPQMIVEKMIIGDADDEKLDAIIKGLNI